MTEQNEEYVNRLFSDDVIACLDALKEADEAVDAINKDMFNQIATVCGEIMNSGGDVSQVKRVLRSFEKKYKESRDVKHMPGSYRSAKSVILSAINEEIPLLDDEGDVNMGKSALEKQISRTRNQRGKKGKSDDLESELGRLLRYIARARLTLTPEDSDELSKVLSYISGEVETIRGKYL